MATGSCIGIKSENGAIRAIYCHNDGYLGCVGETLVEHYGEPAKINALINLGSINSLYPEIGEKHSFEERRNAMFTDEPQVWQNWTLAYNRDRGDEWANCSPIDCKDNRDYTNQAIEVFTSNFVYLWDGEWTFCTEKDILNNNFTFQSVAMSLKNEKER